LKGRTIVASSGDKRFAEDRIHAANAIANLGQIDCFIFLEKHENKQSGKSQM